MADKKITSNAMVLAVENPGFLDQIANIKNFLNHRDDEKTQVDEIIDLTNSARSESNQCQVKDKIVSQNELDEHTVDVKMDETDLNQLSAVEEVEVAEEIGDQSHFPPIPLARKSKSQTLSTSTNPKIMSETHSPLNKVHTDFQSLESGINGYVYAPDIEISEVVSTKNRLEHVDQSKHLLSTLSKNDQSNISFDKSVIYSKSANTASSSKQVNIENRKSTQFQLDAVHLNHIAELNEKIFTVTRRVDKEISFEHSKKCRLIDVPCVRFESWGQHVIGNAKKCVYNRGKTTDYCKDSVPCFLSQKREQTIVSSRPLHQERNPKTMKTKCSRPFSSAY